MIARATAGLASLLAILVLCGWTSGQPGPNWPTHKVSVENQTEQAVRVRSTLKVGGKLWKWDTGPIDSGKRATDPNHYAGKRRFTVWDPSGEALGTKVFEIDGNYLILIKDDGKGGVKLVLGVGGP